jgi:hypothetical protein
VVLTALVIAAAAYAGIHFGLRFPEMHADERSTAFTHAAADTLGALTITRDAVGVITDAGATTDELTSTIGPMLRLETSAARLSDTAGSWLLDLPAPIPTDRLDDLTAGRNRLRAVAGATGDLIDRLHNVADYRLGAATLLRLPSLPNPGNPIPAAHAEEAMSEMLADAVASLGRLPDDTALRDHRDQAAELVLWLGEWQGRYFSALQDGDLQLAVRLEREAQDRIADHHLALLGPLADIEAWADRTVAALEWQLTEATILIGT